MLKVLTNTSIFISNGKISDSGEELIIPKGYYAVPGFIDVPRVEYSTRWVVCGCYLRRRWTFAGNFGST